MADPSYIDFLELSSRRGLHGGPEKSETVVIYITGSDTGDQEGNDRTFGLQRGSSRSSIDSDIQVRIQRQSRQSRHTPQAGSHDSPSPSPLPV
jgi:hypothetical protein